MSDSIKTELSTSHQGGKKPIAYAASQAIRAIYYTKFHLPSILKHMQSSSREHRTQSVIAPGDE